ncbi:hypothetical protein GOV09_00205 [Candidatus Woesearchaeota archaeon]|nr:hypothetical protein [Candidatus Woesearchaeota archaeon]
MEKRQRRKVKFKFYTLIALILFVNICYKFRNMLGIDILRDTLELVKSI